MARRKSKKSSKCPEPLNTLIDIAGGLAMGAVANRMEKKYHYSEKGKINPYAVSAAGIATGRMKSTKDILRTGAVLGAMGSFDVDADDEGAGHSFVPEDPVFTEIRGTKVNDNRYAWRLNCEDGSTYGIFPEWYETRDAYNAALAEAKGLSSEEADKEVILPNQIVEEQSEPLDVICLRVSRLDNGANEFYLTRDKGISVGDTVTLPAKNGTAQGIVIGIDEHPKNASDILYIL